MKKNVGAVERWFRGFTGLALLVCSGIGPFPLVVRLTVFGAMGSYLLFTAVAGTCFGYRLMGLSTCRLERR